MQRKPLALGALTLATAILLVACESKPPVPKIEWSPSNKVVTAGETIELRATKPLAHEKETFSYQWTMKGACAGKLQNATEWKVTYAVPDDCAGGDLEFVLVSSARQGETTQSVSFTLKPKPVEKIGVTPVRFDKVPESWDVLHDFSKPFAEKDADRRNNHDAYFGTWTYRDGKCALSTKQDGGSGVLQVAFTLPHSNLSSCGYFEYFDGPPGDAKAADISGFDRLTFIARSASDQPVWIRLELVEFDKYTNYNQGIVSESDPIRLDGEWRRHEVRLKSVARTWDLSSAKSVGFRIDSKDDNPATGTVLVDDLALIRAK